MAAVLRAWHGTAVLSAYERGDVFITDTNRELFRVKEDVNVMLHG